MAEIEMTLGDTTPEGGRAVESPVSLADPDKFDLEAWLAGARPARRATTVYARPDLLADIDVLAERILAARGAGHDVEAARLEVQANMLRDEMAASSLDIVVEASSDRVRAQLREALGIVEGQDPTEDQTLRYVAAHIVAPVGFDADALIALNEISPRQVLRVANAVKVANDTAPAVPAPFSPASSSGRRARG